MLTAKKRLIVSTMLLTLLPAMTNAKGGALAHIFVPEMLGADLSYFENVTGPAWRTFDTTKIYKVDSCEVTATVVNGAIRALHLQLSNKCTFDLNTFLNFDSGKFPPPQTMTFGIFDALTDGSGQFKASCLSDCGNAYEPVVYEHWAGSRAGGYIEVELEAELGTAADTWQEAMESGEGETWVIDGKYNCEGSKYDALAHKAFKDVTISGITIGFDIESFKCN